MRPSSTKNPIKLIDYSKYIENTRELTDTEIEEIIKDKQTIDYLKNGDNYNSIFEKIKVDYKERFGKDLELNVIKKVVNEYFRLIVFFTENKFETLVPRFFKIVHKITRQKSSTNNIE